MDPTKQLVQPNCCLPFSVNFSFPAKKLLKWFDVTHKCVYEFLNWSIEDNFEWQTQRNKINNIPHNFHFVSNFMILSASIHKTYIFSITFDEGPSISTNNYLFSIKFSVDSKIFHFCIFLFSKHLTFASKTHNHFSIRSCDFDSLMSNHSIRNQEWIFARESLDFTKST